MPESGRFPGAKLIQHGRWLVPEQVTAHQLEKWTTHAHERLDLAIKFICTRDIALQAGGNLGIWPYLLVKEYGFKHVLYLRAGPGEPGVSAANTLSCRCLPWRRSWREFGMGRPAGCSDPKGRPGWHKIHPEGVNYGRKWVDMVAIDGLPLEHVEPARAGRRGLRARGAEGGRAHLVRDRPVVIIEDLHRSRFKSFRRLGGIAYGHPPGRSCRALVRVRTAATGQASCGLSPTNDDDLGVMTSV